MTTIDAIALGLATFYVAFVVSRTNGPFNMFSFLRERLPLGGLTACLYCVSIWAALVMWVILQVWPPGVYIFAAAGSTVGIYRYTGADLS